MQINIDECKTSTGQNVFFHIVVDGHEPRVIEVAGKLMQHFSTVRGDQYITVHVSRMDLQDMDRRRIFPVNNIVRGTFQPNYKDMQHV